MVKSEGTTFVLPVGNSVNPPCVLLTLWACAIMRHKTGEVIPASGIYRVHHDAHRLPHEVTLIEGYKFPRCQKCADDVQFEPVALAGSWKSGPSRTIILHELPEVPAEKINGNAA